MVWGGRVRPGERDLKGETRKWGAVFRVGDKHTNRKEDRITVRMAAKATGSTLLSI